jgi:hypothetical protein
MPPSPALAFDAIHPSAIDIQPAIGQARKCMKQYYKAFIEGMRRGARETPRGFFAPFLAFYRWLSRKAQRTAKVGEPSNARRTGVYIDPPIWRGPPLDLPDHIRRHGIKLQGYGLDPGAMLNASSKHATQRPYLGKLESMSELLIALITLQDRMTALERRQDAQERELAKWSTLHSTNDNSTDSSR